MFDSLLVANSGEVARRIIRSAHNLGVLTVLIPADGGGVGVDSRYQRGDVTPYHDSLLAKLEGIRTNLWFFAQRASAERFRDGGRRHRGDLRSPGRPDPRRQVKDATVDIRAARDVVQEEDGLLAIVRTSSTGPGPEVER